MSNPLMIEDPFWTSRRRVSGAVILGGLVLALVFADGEAFLHLALGAGAPLACLWTPYALANFPFAGMFFTGRPASHTSSEESVIIIGWILLVIWVGYAVFELLES